MNTQHSGYGCGEKMIIDIKLQEAKRAIGITNFKRDDLLKIALTDLSDLNHPEISEVERERSKRDYQRLAFLGDALFDAVLADYLFDVNQDLTHEDFDDWRKDIASTESFTEFAIDLGLPRFSSSWDKPSRKPPEEEPRLWAEMFEAVIAVIFIDCDRDFLKLSTWLCDRFIRYEIGAEVGDPDCDTTVTTADYLDMIGLEGSLGSVWAPGDDDDS
jgi:dsRNA-specific ribonuclease